MQCVSRAFDQKVLNQSAIPSQRLGADAGRTRGNIRKLEGRYEAPGVTDEGARAKRVEHFSGCGGRKSGR